MTGKVFKFILIGIYMDIVRQKLEDILRKQQTCAKYHLAVLIKTPDLVYIPGWNGSPTCIINGECFKKDDNPELCHPIHAEVRAICQAAKEGISVEDSTIY